MAGRPLGSLSRRQREGKDETSPVPELIPQQKLVYFDHYKRVREESMRKADQIVAENKELKARMAVAGMEIQKLREKLSAAQE